MESCGSSSEGDSTSAEVGNDEADAGSPPKTLFTPQLPTSAHLIATTPMLLIPPFG